MRYIGIKTKLLPYIKEEIKKVTPKDGCVLDMFAGSTIVGQSLMPQFLIYSNDIQKYSWAVGKATIETDKNFDYSSLSYKKVVASPYFQDNFAFLLSIFKEPYDYEKALFKKLENNPSLDVLLEFKKYYDCTPYSGHFNSADVPLCFKKISSYFSNSFYEKCKKDKKHYLLFTLDYSCPYFSTEQAMFIDSFRFAIDQMLANKEISSVEFYAYLSYLIFYLGSIVTSVGDHFAQPQQLKLSTEKRLQKEVKKIILKKNVNIDALLTDLESQFRSIKPSKRDNKMFCEDYKRLFESDYSLYMDKVNTIYIDPPYTNAHYSRFYHILETLVKYDYPDIEFFGRYRSDRYQSPFCIRSEALIEFEKMIELCCKRNKNLVISYSDTAQCILSKEEVVNICKKWYSKTSIKEIDYLYRNFGQKPNKVKGNELLIVCRAN